MLNIFLYFIIIPTMSQLIIIEHLKKHLKFFSYNEEAGRTEIVKAVDTKLMKAKEDECEINNATNQLLEPSSICQVPQDWISPTQ